MTTLYGRMLHSPLLFLLVLCAGCIEDPVGPDPTYTPPPVSTYTPSPGKPTGTPTSLPGHPTATSPHDYTRTPTPVPGNPTWTPTSPPGQPTATSPQNPTMTSTPLPGDPTETPGTPPDTTSTPSPTNTPKNASSCASSRWSFEIPDGNISGIFIINANGEHSIESVNFEYESVESFAYWNDCIEGYDCGIAFVFTCYHNGTNRVSLQMWICLDMEDFYRWGGKATTFYDECPEGVVLYGDPIYTTRLD